MKRGLSILTLIILFCNFTVYPPGTSDFESFKETSIFVKAQLTNHSPIVIGSDSDFETQGWPGDGTVENPYKIESLRISGETCIQIENTTLHFSITDCEIIYQYIDSTSALGITIGNASYGSIERCIITGFENDVYHFGIGIGISNSRECSVADNSITECVVGFHLFNSNDTIIEDNTIISTVTCFRTIVACANITLRGNWFEKTYNAYVDDSMFFMGGWNWTIEDNDIVGRYGSSTYISLFDSKVTNNRVEGVSFYFYGNEHVLFSSNRFKLSTEALSLSSCKWVTITNNQFVENAIGIKVHRSNHTILYNNSLSSSGENGYDDYGYNNTWDDGVSQGNIWSDYNGTGVYYIPGSTGSVDRYPMILETTTPLSSTTTNTTPPPNGSYPPNDYTLAIVVGGVSIVALILVVFYLRSKRH